MASAGARAYMGVWGLAPSGVQGQSPWSGGQGGEAPLKLTRFWHYGTIFVSKCLYTLPNSVAFVNEQQTGNLQVFLCYARTFYLSASRGLLSRLLGLGHLLYIPFPNYLPPFPLLLSSQ